MIVIILRTLLCYCQATITHTESRRWCTTWHFFSPHVGPRPFILQSPFLLSLFSQVSTSLFPLCSFGSILTEFCKAGYISSPDYTRTSQVALSLWPQILGLTSQREWQHPSLESLNLALTFIDSLFISLSSDYSEITSLSCKTLTDTVPSLNMVNSMIETLPYASLWDMPQL